MKRDGNCTVPTVDAASVMQESGGSSFQPSNEVTKQEPAVLAPACTTTVMTTNGVDLKGLLNFVEMGILGGIAAG